MTSLPFVGTQIVYLLLGAVSLVDYFRSRDRPRLVVALTFGAFGGFILTQDLLAVNSPIPGIHALNWFLLPLHAYLLVLLVNYFRPVPAWVRWSALVGLLAVSAIDWVFGGRTNGGTGLFILLYFVVFEAYAAIIMVQGARHSAGVTRRRLTLAAAGSGALALVMAYLVAAIFLKPLQAQIVWVVPLGTSLAALCQYLGFATPGWLREPWQLAELYGFLRKTGGEAIDQRAELALNELCLTGMRACGGLAAAAALPDGAQGQFKLHWPPNGPPPGGPLPDGQLPALQGALARVWSSRKPQIATGSADFGLPAPALAALAGADTMLAVPILSGGNAWGVLLVFRRGQSPFVEADVGVLTLLANQVALSLEYAALIGQLRQRTAQLEVANKELEAFSYSVSHDLRAPLRAMDGFSLALIEDYGPQLPAEAQAYLGRIRAAAQRMGELVDDLLSLSQLTRVEMRSEQVNLSQLAQSVADDLRNSQPERSVSFAITPDIVVAGDARLLRVVLINLMTNAWKFTGKRASATIEFGMLAPNGENAYYVRDDGAGFDMNYAGRLFGVFQRLHTASEFPGTGIGLATVQRIVQRHGGRIWAEAAVDQGATFYFTLAPHTNEVNQNATL